MHSSLPGSLRLTAFAADPSVPFDSIAVPAEVVLVGAVVAPSGTVTDSFGNALERPSEILLAASDAAAATRWLADHREQSGFVEAYVVCPEPPTVDRAAWLEAGVTGWGAPDESRSLQAWIIGASRRRDERTTATRRAELLDRVLRKLPDRIHLITSEGQFVGDWPPPGSDPLPVGRGMTEVMPSDLIEASLALGTRAWETGSEQQELMRYSQGTTTRHLDVRAVPLDDRVLLVSSRDVTAQHADRQKLEHHRRLLGLLQEMTESGHWEWSEAERRLWLSPRAAAIFGLGDGAWEGAFAELVESRVAPADIMRVRRGVEALRSTDRIRVDQVRIVPRPGEERVIWSLARSEFDADGMIVRAYGAVHDVTTTARIREELAARERELAEIAKVSVLGLLGSQIAHELNQPLYSISNYAEAARLRLLEREDAETPSEIIDWLERIGEQARVTGESIRRMTRLLQRKGSSPVVHDLRDAIAETMPMFAERFEELGIAVERRIPNEPCLVRSDRLMMRQVIAILVTNAIEAIAARTDRPPSLCLSLVGEGRNWVLGVRDNGVGLPHDRFMGLCRPFVTDKPDAMGVGLSIAKAILESVHGRIWAEPCGGEGADVRCAVPKHQGNDS